MNLIDLSRRIPHPLRNIVALSPESIASARARSSEVLVLTTSVDDNLRGGYPDPTFRAIVLSCGPDVKDLATGDIVVVKAYKNLDDVRFKFDDETVIYIEDKLVMGVVDS